MNAKTLTVQEAFAFLAAATISYSERGGNKISCGRVPLLPELRRDTFRHHLCIERSGCIVEEDFHGIG